VYLGTPKFKSTPEFTFFSILYVRLLYVRIKINLKTVLLIVSVPEYRRGPEWLLYGP